MELAGPVKDYRVVVDVLFFPGAELVLQYLHLHLENILLVNSFLWRRQKLGGD